MFQIQVQFDDGSWSTIHDYERTLFSSSEDANLHLETDPRLDWLRLRSRVRVVSVSAKSRSR